MEKRKFDLVKEDIMSFEDWKAVRPDPDIRPFIGKTIYTYEAYPAKLKIINENTKQVTTFNGKFCGKRVMFKIDHDRGLITIEGIIKPPKDPLKKLFWEKGFTGARRVTGRREDGSINEMIHSDIRYHEYVRINGKLVETSLLPETPENDIVLAFDTDSHNWYASDDLTLEEVKPVLEVYRDHKV